jgi:hypothetical protein
MYICIYISICNYAYCIPDAKKADSINPARQHSIPIKDDNGNEKDLVMCLTICKHKKISNKKKS